MWSALAYPIALGLVALVVARGDDERMQRTALVLGLNWAACIFVFWLTGIAAPWGWLLVIDIATAYAILHPPAGRVQALIGGLLISQVLWHAAFGYVGNIQSAEVYIAALNIGGFVQVGILLGGATYDKGRGILAVWRGRSCGAPSAQAVGASMAERGQP